MALPTSYALDVDFTDPDTGLYGSMSSVIVPVSEEYPEGVRYSFVILKAGKRLIGYDNFGGHLEHGRHHKHIGERVVAYHFVDVWKLCEDFANDWERTKREHARG